jgi:ABC-type uncharacterized transport system substrate-binding protein
LRTNRLGRREFIALLGSATATWPVAARAQPRKLPRIGVLVSASPPHPFADAFRRGLRTFGYSEGQNIAVEFRYTEGRSDRAEEFAEELARLNVDIIVAHFVPAVEAAMGATQTIPIVMAPHGAPLQLGAIGSLARPGGNVTGLSAMDAERLIARVTAGRQRTRRSRARPGSTALPMTDRPKDYRIVALRPVPCLTTLRTAAEVAIVRPVNAVHMTHGFFLVP